MIGMNTGDGNSGRPGSGQFCKSCGIERYGNHRKAKDIPNCWLRFSMCSNCAKNKHPEAYRSHWFWLHQQCTCPDCGSVHKNPYQQHGHASDIKELERQLAELKQGVPLLEATYNDPSPETASLAEKIASEETQVAPTPHYTPEEYDKQVLRQEHGIGGTSPKKVKKSPKISIPEEN